MERIQLATPEGSVDAVVASPDGSGPWPGVVIVHDMISATSGGLPGIIERVLTDVRVGVSCSLTVLRHTEKLELKIVPEEAK